MKNCQFCKAPNQAEGRFCSKICATRYINLAMSSPRWTEEEDELLVENIGELPSKELISAYKKSALKLGFPQRTSEAIDRRLSKISKEKGLSRDCVDDNFPICAAAKFLGVSKEILKKFVYSKELPAKKVTNSQSAIRKSHLAKLVLKYPEYFAKCETERLFWLFEHGEEKKVMEKIARIKSAEPVRPKSFRVTDGAIAYPSVRAAAKANHCHQTTIRRAMKANKTVNGKRFELL